MKEKFMGGYSLKSIAIGMLDCVVIHNLNLFAKSITKSY